MKVTCLLFSCSKIKCCLWRGVFFRGTTTWVRIQGGNDNDAGRATCNNTKTPLFDYSLWKKMKQQQHGNDRESRKKKPAKQSNQPISPHVAFLCCEDSSTISSILIPCRGLVHYSYIILALFLCFYKPILTCFLLCAYFTLSYAF